MSPEAQEMTLDQIWRKASLLGDQDLFARWMGLVEIPLRRSLGRWSRAVDVEVVLQETFLRMWLRALDGPAFDDERNASLRFAHRVSVNVAREEVRRAHTNHLVQLEGMVDPPELPVDPGPVGDHALAKIIRLCIEKLPPKPQEALLARLKLSAKFSDREIASKLRMKKNTLLQNIVRARKFLERCLAENEVSLEEVLR